MRLQLHPQVAVVVLDHVAARRRAGHDRAAALGDEDARPHGLATRVLEDDVGVLAHQAADVLAQTAPLGLVLGVLVLPEPVPALLAVDHVLTAQFAQRLDLARRSTPRRSGVPPAVEHVLDREGPMPPVAPQISTLSPWVTGAPLRETSIRYAVELHSALTAASSQRQVGRLGHELVRLHQAMSARPPKFVSKPQMRWLVGEHRVVVRARVLVVDVVAVHRDLVADLPVAHRGAGAQHDTGGVRADHVVVEGVARAPDDSLAEPVEESEGRHRLEDARPHRVEVDRARHDDDEGLVGGEFGHGDVVDVQALAGVLVRGGDAVEHRRAPPGARTPRAIGAGHGPSRPAHPVWHRRAPRRGSHSRRRGFRRAVNRSARLRSPPEALATPSTCYSVKSPQTVSEDHHVTQRHRRREPHRHRKSLRAVRVSYRDGPWRRRDHAASSSRPAWTRRASTRC